MSTGDRPGPTRPVQTNIAFLANDIGRLYRKRFDTTARALGVTGPQWRVLAALNFCPGITQAALAGLLDVEAITVGRMIDRLQKSGMVERRPAPADRRAWLLYITPAAESLLVELQKMAEALMAETLSNFAPEEFQQLVGLLNRLRDNLVPEAVPA
ncbi:MarR family winged helix-turn-helix transcriptional regulator [Novosphingobium bradum]|uniref:MarR family winged helix-turn-helix transcriptional regulator n=1 Tax=Novosphingobium bradum TaxID=1737444 RepID=A0ABV7IUR2_9SPHN